MRGFLVFVGLAATMLPLVPCNIQNEERDATMAGVVQRERLEMLMLCSCPMDAESILNKSLPSDDVLFGERSKKSGRRGGRRQRWRIPLFPLEELGANELAQLGICLG